MGVTGRWRVVGGSWHPGRLRCVSGGPTAYLPYNATGCDPGARRDFGGRRRGCGRIGGAHELCAAPPPGPPTSSAPRTRGKHTSYGPHRPRQMGVGRHMVVNAMVATAVVASYTNIGDACAGRTAAGMARLVRPGTSRHECEVVWRCTHIGVMWSQPHTTRAAVLWTAASHARPPKAPPVLCTAGGGTRLAAAARSCEPAV